MNLFNKFNQKLLRVRILNDHVDWIFQTINKSQQFQTQILTIKIFRMFYIRKLRHENDSFKYI